MRRHAIMGEREEKTGVGRSNNNDRTSEHSLLGFGEYYDWTYGQVMKATPNYVTYICQECTTSSQEQEQFQEWVTSMAFGSEREAEEV